MSDEDGYCEGCGRTDEHPPQHCQDCPKLDGQPGWFIAVSSSMPGVCVEIYGCTNCGFTGYADEEPYTGLYGACPSCGKKPNQKKLNRKFKNVMVENDDGSITVQKFMPRKAAP